MGKIFDMGRDLVKDAYRLRLEPLLNDGFRHLTSKERSLFSDHQAAADTFAPRESIHHIMERVARVHAERTTAQGPVSPAYVLKRNGEVDKALADIHTKGYHARAPDAPLQPVDEHKRALLIAEGIVNGIEQSIQEFYQLQEPEAAEMLRPLLERQRFELGEMIRRAKQP